MVDGKFCNRNWIGFGLAIMFVLIGISVLVNVLYGSNVSTGYNFGWWPWGLFGIIFVFWICSWMFRPLYCHWHRNHEDILKERYARGEISKKQYKDMLKDLGED